MRNHVLAFAKAALDASGGDVQLIGVPEQAFSLSGSNNFQIPVPLKAYAAYAGGVGLARARINTGSLRQRGFPQIFPLNATVLPPSPAKVMHYENFPLQLVKEEDLRIDVTNGAANDVVCGVWVTPDDMDFNINSRDLRAIRFTASVTAASFGWSTPATIILQDLIEGGVYDIYGLAVQSTAGILARLILQGQFYRPGCIIQTPIQSYPDEKFFGRTGKWGSFNSYALPQIETLETGAGASAITGWLLCSKSMAQTNTDYR